MKNRAIKNTKHRLAKAFRRMWRTGDDWAVASNKQFKEADRQAVKRIVRQELKEVE